MYYFKGDKKKAVSIIKDYVNKVPNTSLDSETLLRLFEGEFIDDSNVTIELNGYQDAKRVFVNGLPVKFNFLVKKEGKWIGKYKLDQGTYNYTFTVDGNEVLDSKTPVKITASVYEDWYRSHQLCVDISEQSYQTKIIVKVPNKNDVIYIAGNQRNLTYWSPVFRLNKISDYEREITLDLHYPVKFKLIKSDFKTEAIIKGNKKDDSENWLPIEINFNTENKIFEIISWEN